jgi:hypothetical protein
MVDSLIAKYNPVLYFTSDEVCYPISIEKYLSQCNLNQGNQVICSTVDSIELYNIHNNNRGNIFTDSDEYHLSFKDDSWNIELTGDPNSSTVYAKSIKRPQGGYILIYFYLYSHTIPYKLLGCCCKLQKFAHKADLKFVAVYLDQNQEIEGIYYGAHCQLAGQYISAKDITFENDSHPVVYPCSGDHSNYYTAGCRPRIFCAVYDRTAHEIISQPNIVRVFDDNDQEFDPATMGWLYFPGKMNSDGINSPANQCFWTADLPINNSNNWFRRMCCINYF